MEHGRRASTPSTYVTLRHRCMRTPLRAPRSLPSPRMPHTRYARARAAATRQPVISGTPHLQRYTSTRGARGELEA